MNKESIINSIWVEKHRPKLFSDIVMPDTLEKFLHTLKDDGVIPNLLFSGPAGTGKTTTAKAIITELGAKDDFIHLNCSKKTSINDIRNEVEPFATTHSATFDSGLKVCIMDEADRLSPQAMDSLKVFIEETYKICRFIFITNHSSKIIPPLMSRLQHFSFGENEEEKIDLQKKMTKRCANILKEEGVDFDKKALFSLVKGLYPDFRSIINKLQQVYKSFGVVDERALNRLDKTQLDDIMTSMKKMDFNSMRNICSSIDSLQFFTNFYNEMDNLVKNECKPTIVSILGEYVYRDGIATNKEINLFAGIVELSRNIKWL